MPHWRIARGSLILFLLLLLASAISAGLFREYSAAVSRIGDTGAGSENMTGWIGKNTARPGWIYLGCQFVILILGGVTVCLTRRDFNRSVLEPVASLIRSIHQMEAAPPDRSLPAQPTEELNRLAEAINGLVLRTRAARSDSDRQSHDMDLCYRAVIEAFPSPFFLMANDGVIERLNPAASEMLSRLGLDDRLPPVVQRLVEATRHHELDYLPDNPSQAVYIRAGEEESYYLPRIFNLKGGTGCALGVAVILVDVTRVRWLDDLKTSQIATVSHEIKTPLTAIRVMLHLLLEKKFGALNTNQEDMMRLACEDCERLLRTLNHLLELSRLEAGAEQLQMAPEKPEELVCLAVSAVSEVALLRKIRFAVESAPDCPDVRVDAARVGHVLGNLLSNAVKFSPEGSMVRVRTAESETGFVRFSVIDQGVGIAEEYQSRIFERFFRLPGTGGEGVGLGLSIAREIVRAHQGRIGVISAPGQGSEFYCDLPASPPAG